jgi:hypothetical protein
VPGVAAALLKVGPVTPAVAIQGFAPATFVTMGYAIADLVAQGCVLCWLHRAVQPPALLHRPGAKVVVTQSRAAAGVVA